MDQEMFTIYGENNEVIGTASRTQAHAQGLWHEVVHCWVVQKIGEETWLYFQQRAHTKKDFPDYYDIVSTGHVDAGERHSEAVLREVREEIGLHLEREEVRYLGSVKEEIEFEDFHDREIVQIYLYLTTTVPKFQLGDEVDRMVRIKLEEYIKKEEGKTAQIQAYGMDGKKILIGREEFCRHSFPPEIVREL